MNDILMSWSVALPSMNKIRWTLGLVMYMNLGISSSVTLTFDIDFQY